MNQKGLHCLWLMTSQQHGWLFFHMIKASILLINNDKLTAWSNKSSLIVFLLKSGVLTFLILVWLKKKNLWPVCLFFQIDNLLQVNFRFKPMIFNKLGLMCFYFHNSRCNYVFCLHLHVKKTKVSAEQQKKKLHLKVKFLIRTEL